MKSKTSVIKFMFLPFSIVLLATTFLYYFVYNIYEVEIVSDPKIAFADPAKKVKVIIKPINAMGWSVPLRTVSGTFKITEGINNIEIISINEEEGTLILRSTGVVGTVGIYVESDYSLFPSYIEISFLPRRV